MDKDLAPARCGQLRLTRAALLASVVLPIVCLVILAGCAMHSDWQKPPEEYARPPRADSLFAAAEQRIADRHAPTILASPCSNVATGRCNGALC